MIILPFVIPVLWGIILAITLYPFTAGCWYFSEGEGYLRALSLTVLLLLPLLFLRPG